MNLRPATGGHNRKLCAFEDYTPLAATVGNLSILRRMPWRTLCTRLILLALAIAFIFLFPADTPGGNDLNDKVLSKASDVLFNFLSWEVDALTHKVLQQQAGIAPYLSEADRSKYVHDYLQAVTQYEIVQSKIDQLYSNARIIDPAAASTDLIKQRDAFKITVDKQQPLAEAIVETQVGSVLRDEGFATLGAILPPVSAHITKLPMLLIISPRDKINFQIGVTVENMTAAQQTAIEDSIDQALGVSSLVEPLGGLALYPTMVAQTYSASFLFDVVSHEWSHNYMYFFPLGLGYESAPETRIINESTATLLGHEISAKVIQRFYKDYPDFMRQIPAPALPPSNKPAATAAPLLLSDPDQPQPFSFDAEMNKTRITVDFYLHFGLVDLAEGYMRSERDVFANHGYIIRKLNQAYFAFHGGYQAAGGGAGGSDPTGPAITEIRQRSPSLKAWMEIMRSITTRDQLLATRDALRRQQSATPTP